MGHEVIAKKGAGKHRGSNIHTNTGVIQKKAVMERERHGDAVRDGAQQNTCHIWREEQCSSRTQQQTRSTGQCAQKGHHPAASPLPHGRRVTRRCRAASHMWTLSVDFNSNSIITRILPMGLWSKDMSSLTWCLVVCKSEFQK